MRWIATNAGHEGSIVVQRVKEMDGDEGFNAQTEHYEDLVRAGVINPTKVVRSALQNAASIAGLLLTTEAVISRIPEENASGRCHTEICSELVVEKLREDGGRAVQPDGRAAPGHAPQRRRVPAAPRLPAQWVR